MIIRRITAFITDTSAAIVIVSTFNLNTFVVNAFALGKTEMPQDVFASFSVSL